MLSFIWWVAGSDRGRGGGPGIISVLSFIWWVAGSDRGAGIISLLSFICRVAGTKNLVKNVRLMQFIISLLFSSHVYMVLRILLKCHISVVIISLLVFFICWVAVCVFACVCMCVCAHAHAKVGTSVYEHQAHPCPT